MVATLAICPQVSWAEGFTGQEFLEWSDSNQRNYIETQIVMASSIAARIKPQLSQCITDEFFGSKGLSQDGFSKVLTRVEEFSEYHPSSVLVIVLENTCGAFK